jgi:DNA-binding MarR family transcriptional regulator
MTMHSKTDSFLAKSGVTCDQYVLLHILCRKKPIAQETLTARAALDPTAIERLLLVLEGRGIVARHWCKEGRDFYKRLSRRRTRKAARFSRQKSVPL